MRGTYSSCLASPFLRCAMAIQSVDGWMDGGTALFAPML
jgi:hypothetical protein